MKDLTEIVARAIDRELEGPVNNGDFKRQTAQWAHAKQISEAVLSALREAGALVEWKPIESAPRDGSAFLAYGGGLDEVETCRYNLRVGCWDAETCTLDDLDCEPQGFDRPTHWSPLPKPPEVAMNHGDAE